MANKELLAWFIHKWNSTHPLDVANTNISLSSSSPSSRGTLSCRVLLQPELNTPEPGNEGVWDCYKYPHRLKLNSAGSWPSRTGYPFYITKGVSQAPKMTKKASREDSHTSLFLTQSCFMTWEQLKYSGQVICTTVMILMWCFLSSEIMNCYSRVVFSAFSPLF